MKSKLIHFLFLMICFPAVVFGKLEILSGKVYEVFPSDDQFTITVNSNGMARIMQLKVDAETKYKGVSNLGELKLDQLIKIEFDQDKAGEFLVKNLEATPMPEKKVQKKKKEEVF